MAAFEGTVEGPVRDEGVGTRIVRGADRAARRDADRRWATLRPGTRTVCALDRSDAAARDVDRQWAGSQPRPGTRTFVGWIAAAARDADRQRLDRSDAAARDADRPWARLRRRGTRIASVLDRRYPQDRPVLQLLQPTEHALVDKYNQVRHPKLENWRPHKSRLVDVVRNVKEALDDDDSPPRDADTPPPPPPPVERGRSTSETHIPLPAIPAAHEPPSGRRPTRFSRARRRGRVAAAPRLPRGESP